MADLMNCPNCANPLPRRAMECPTCGANIALATAVAERKAVRLAETRPLPPLAPELLIPRLGDFLVQRGFLNAEQLEAGLAYQKQENQLGQPVLLGQALIALGLLERTDLDAAVTEQIVMLQDALRKTNVELDSRVHQRTAELQAALDRLTELSELKNNFISNVSHELRTPLTHLSGYLELMADGAFGPMNEAALPAMEVMLRAYKRLDALIENLIQVAVMARGEVELRLETVLAATLAEEAVRRNEALAAQHAVNLRLTQEDSPLAVNADVEKVTWVLEQLIENAIKFNHPGGDVTLSVTKGKGGVRFEVRDTGSGIPPERIDELFLPFHQLDGSNTRNVGGTGLGLALVRQIVESHGSEVDVTSTPGAGSCFGFVLPRGDA
ncbi:MAG: hypothetical protein EPO32_13390 [Anaerolineae bacterium]|nr:MAG: hypothetical protein EPO32_13390 [Anaerolineae bacterium]